MKTREKRIEIVSPPGVARFPHLNTPDTKFATADKPHGEYRVNLVLDRNHPGVPEFLERLSAEYEAAQEKALEKTKGKPAKRGPEPFKADTDEEGNETSSVVVSAKMSAHVKVGSKTGTTREWDQRPGLFDAKLKKIDPKIGIGGGSVLRLSFEVYAYYTAMVGAGISLRLNAVQVLELVQRGERDGAGHGFGKQDDGYEFSAPEGDGEENTAGAVEMGAGEPDRDF